MPRSAAAAAVAAAAALLTATSAAAGPLTCPVLSCAAGGGGAAASAPASGDETPRLATQSETPCQEVSNYSISYSPGHFTCMSCDPGSCDGCAVLCDLSSCVGEFYTQECWCSGGSGGKSTAFCNPTCNGGVCDTPGYSCEPREKACQPWWWCGSPPPKEFLQRQTSLRRASASAGGHLALASSSAASSRSTAHARASSQAARLTAWRRRERRQVSAARRLSAALRTGHQAPEVPNLRFRPGRFVCEDGALPPKTRDPSTLLWLERGYLVLDKRSCEGSLFDHECYCWDEFNRLKGKDPFTSQFKCDAKCQYGSCEGRTCGMAPPPKRLPEPDMAPPAASGVLDTVMNVVMEPVHDRALPERIVRGAEG